MIRIYNASRVVMENITDIVSIMMDIILLVIVYGLKRGGSVRQLCL